MSDYPAFVASRASKTAELKVDAGILDEHVIAVKELAGMIDDYKRHLFYGTDIQSGANKVHRTQTRIEAHDQFLIDLVHSVYGILGEACELFERLHADMNGSTGIDRVQWIEELGDMAFYEQLGYTALNTSREKIEKVNTDKLTARYPTGFDAKKAIHRDLQNERDTMESSLS